MARAYASIILKAPVETVWSIVRDFNGLPNWTGVTTSNIEKGLDADGVTVRSDEVMLRANRVIVAVPIAIAGQIDYEPMLPADRSFLHQRMPLGAVFKIALVYDEPFWRADGLSGQSFAPGSAANLTIDSCTPEARPGVLTVITEGPTARRIGRLTASERRAAVLDGVAETRHLQVNALAQVNHVEHVRALLGHRADQP